MAGATMYSRIAGLKDEAFMARLNLTMAAMKAWISNSCTNISILIERYGDRCKPLIEHPEQRQGELLAGQPAWPLIP